mmetsp:Transcript_68226/g.142172  ORF Transcript_68226/g.142172 Transcript_68226/m.142172 type:complete len:109 (-) Transcript_68226:91-417(-)
MVSAEGLFRLLREKLSVTDGWLLPRRVEQGHPKRGGAAGRADVTLDRVASLVKVQLELPRKHRMQSPYSQEKGGSVGAGDGRRRGLSSRARWEETRRWVRGEGDVPAE